MRYPETARISELEKQLAEARAEIEHLRQELRDCNTMAARQIVPAEMLVDDLTAEIERRKADYAEMNEERIKWLGENMKKEKIIEQAHRAIKALFEVEEYDNIRLSNDIKLPLLDALKATATTNNDKPRCDCGLSASWHGDKCGRREYCCDECWKKRRLAK